MTATKKTAGVIAPPPLIYLGGLVLGWTADRFLSLPRLRFDETNAVLLGLAGFCLAAIGASWAEFALLRQHTPANPFRETKSLVPRGPYRFSRNPMYVSFTLAYLSVALGLRSITALALLPVVIMVMRYGVIAREERYLAGKFGAEYEEYRRRVRRWI